ncbi:hypothetical protein [Thermococcus peptonophilus]|uniref:Uncharacterized protein n=1 Tax=Thermococcus peptonophilus TaxID=53952 RepID=A0A142CWM2_9EURY|nr:hypothetical protein [Thermococcus peptonophilus]AMQ19174.1 hypothetical protein A0127_08365 [Thermococcus peptonophilus]
MVYYAHGTTPVIFGLLISLYYFSIPAALALWFALSKPYISKGDYRLKRLAVLLLLAFFVTSLAGEQAIDKYLYIHSPVSPEFCLSSSCVTSFEPLQRYHVDTENLEELGIPSYGPMWVYFLNDVGPTHSLGLNKRLEALVVVRPLLLLPVVEVNSYEISRGGKIIGRDRFYVVWPISPGNVLTERFDFEFTVIIVTGGGVGA